MSLETGLICEDNVYACTLQEQDNSFCHIFMQLDSLLDCLRKVAYHFMYFLQCNSFLLQRVDI